MSNSSQFIGTGVALITPFNNQLIDYDSLSNIIEHVIAEGVDYLVPLGSTGEAVMLTTAECQDVINFTVDQAKGRVPIVGGLFGHNHTAHLIKYIDRFDTSKLDALLSSCPGYVKPSQEGLFRHYSALAKSAPKPIILYNVPSRTGVNMLPETVMRLADQFENIIGIKEASGDLAQVEKLTKYLPDDFIVTSGDDPTALASVAVGTQGVISVIANAYPKIFSDMIHLALNDQFKAAYELNQQVQDLHRWLYVEGNPVGIKAAMEHLGFCNRSVRLPLAEMSEQNVEHLVAAMDQVTRS